MVIVFSRLNWHTVDVPLLVALAACAIASDLQAMRTGAAKVRISGSFLALIMAMVFLGPEAAAVLGMVSVAVGWFGSREEPHFLLSNLATYCWFPFVSALAFASARDSLGVNPADAAYYLLVFALFFVSLALNFAWIAAYSSYVTGEPLLKMTRRVLPPVLPSELVSAVFAV